MAFEVTVDNVDTDTVGGFDRVAPGSYHFEITHVDEDGGKKGEMVVKLEVLRGNVSNQEGKEIALYFAKDLSSALAMRKILALAIATGLTTKQQLDQHKANGTSPTLDFNSVVGKQICCNLESNEYDGKTTTRLAWDEIYHPADKRANHIPLLMAKIKTANPPIVLPAGRNPDGAVKTGGNGNGGAAGSATKTSTPKTPSPTSQARSVEEMLG